MEPSKKRRLSILKKNSEELTVEEGPKIKRKISFSGKKSIKEFCAGEEEATIWGTSYEESAENHNICGSGPSRVNVDQKRIGLRNRQVVVSSINSGKKRKSVIKQKPKPNENEKENIFSNDHETNVENVSRQIVGIMAECVHESTQTMPVTVANSKSQTSAHSLNDSTDSQYSLSNPLVNTVDFINYSQFNKTVVLENSVDVSLEKCELKMFKFPNRKPDQKSNVSLGSSSLPQSPMSPSSLHSSSSSNTSRISALNISVPMCKQEIDDLKQHKKQLVDVGATNQPDTILQTRDINSIGIEDCKETTTHSELVEKESEKMKIIIFNDSQSAVLDEDQAGNTYLKLTGAQMTKHKTINFTDQSQIDADCSYRWQKRTHPTIYMDQSIDVDNASCPTMMISNSDRRTISKFENMNISSCDKENLEPPPNPYPNDFREIDVNSSLKQKKVDGGAAGSQHPAAMDISTIAGSCPTEKRKRFLWQTFCYQGTDIEVDATAPKASDIQFDIPTSHTINFDRTAVIENSELAMPTVMGGGNNSHCLDMSLSTSTIDPKITINSQQSEKFERRPQETPPVGSSIECVGVQNVFVQQQELKAADVMDISMEKRQETTPRPQKNAIAAELNVLASDNIDVSMAKPDEKQQNKKSVVIAHSKPLSKVIVKQICVPNTKETKGEAGNFQLMQLKRFQKKFQENRMVEEDKQMNNDTAAHDDMDLSLEIPVAKSKPPEVSEPDVKVKFGGKFNFRQLNDEIQRQHVKVFEDNRGPTPAMASKLKSTTKKSLSSINDCLTVKVKPSTDDEMDLSLPTEDVLKGTQDVMNLNDSTKKVASRNPFNSKRETMHFFTPLDESTAIIRKSVLCNPRSNKTLDVSKNMDIENASCSGTYKLNELVPGNEHKSQAVHEIMEKTKLVNDQSMEMSFLDKTPSDMASVTLTNKRQTIFTENIPLDETQSAVISTKPTRQTVIFTENNVVDIEESASTSILQTQTVESYNNHQRNTTDLFTKTTNQYPKKLENICHQKRLMEIYNDTIEPKTPTRRCISFVEDTPHREYLRLEKESNYSPALPNCEEKRYTKYNRESINLEVSGVSPLDETGLNQNNPEKGFPQQTVQHTIYAPDNTDPELSLVHQSEKSEPNPFTQKLKNKRLTIHEEVNMDLDESQPVNCDGPQQNVVELSRIARQTIFTPENIELESSLVQQPAFKPSTHKPTNIQMIKNKRLTTHKQVNIELEESEPVNCEAQQQKMLELLHGRRQTIIAPENIELEMSFVHQQKKSEPKLSNQKPTNIQMLKTKRLTTHEQVNVELDESQPINCEAPQQKMLDLPRRGRQTIFAPENIELEASLIQQPAKSEPKPSNPKQTNIQMIKNKRLTTNEQVNIELEDSQLVHRDASHQAILELSRKARQTIFAPENIELEASLVQQTECREPKPSIQNHTNIQMIKNKRLSTNELVNIELEETQPVNREKMLELPRRERQTIFAPENIELDTSLVQPPETTKPKPSNQKQTNIQMFKNKRLTSHEQVNVELDESQPINCEAPQQKMLDLPRRGRQTIFAPENIELEASLIQQPANSEPKPSNPKQTNIQMIKNKRLTTNEQVNIELEDSQLVHRDASHQAILELSRKARQTIFAPENIELEASLVQQTECREPKPSIQNHTNIQMIKNKRLSTNELVNIELEETQPVNREKMLELPRRERQTIFAPENIELDTSLVQPPETSKPKPSNQKHTNIQMFKNKRLTSHEHLNIELEESHPVNRDSPHQTILELSRKARQTIFAPEIIELEASLAQQPENSEPKPSNPKQTNIQMLKNKRLTTHEHVNIEMEDSQPINREAPQKKMLELPRRGRQTIFAPEHIELEASLVQQPEYSEPKPSTHKQTNIQMIANNRLTTNEPMNIELDKSQPAICDAPQQNIPELSRKARQTILASDNIELELSFVHKQKNSEPTKKQTNIQMLRNKRLTTNELVNIELDETQQLGEKMLELPLRGRQTIFAPENIELEVSLVQQPENSERKPPYQKQTIIQMFKNKRLTTNELVNIKVEETQSINREKMLELPRRGQQTMFAPENIELDASLVQQPENSERKPPYQKQTNIQMFKSKRLTSHEHVNIELEESQAVNRDAPQQKMLERQTIFAPEYIKLEASLVKQPDNRNPVPAQRQMLNKRRLTTCNPVSIDLEKSFMPQPEEKKTTDATLGGNNRQMPDNRRLSTYEPIDIEIEEDDYRHNLDKERQPTTDVEMEVVLSPPHEMLIDQTSIPLIDTMEVEPSYSQARGALQNIRQEEQLLYEVNPKAEESKGRTHETDLKSIPTPHPRETLIFKRQDTIIQVDDSTINLSYGGEIESNCSLDAKGYNISSLSSPQQIHSDDVAKISPNREEIVANKKSTRISHIPIPIDSAKKVNSTSLRPHEASQDTISDEFTADPLLQSFDTIEFTRRVIMPMRKECSIILQPRRSRRSIVGQTNYVDYQECNEIRGGMPMEENPITIYDDTTVFAVGNDVNFSTLHRTMSPCNMDVNVLTADNDQSKSTDSSDTTQHKVAKIKKQYIELSCNSIIMHEDIDQTRLSLVNTLPDETTIALEQEESLNAQHAQPEPSKPSKPSSSSPSAATSQHSAPLEPSKPFATAVDKSTLTELSAAQLELHVSVCHRCKRDRKSTGNLNDTTISDFRLEQKPEPPQLQLDFSALLELRAKPDIYAVSEYWQKCFREAESYAIYSKDFKAMKRSFLKDTIEQDDAIIARLEEIQKNRELKLEQEQAQRKKKMEQTIHDSFVRRLQRFKSKETNWIFTDVLTVNNILKFTHKRMRTFAIIVTYTPKDPPLGLEADVNEIKLTTPRQNLEPFEHMLHFQLLIEMPYNLKTLCPTSHNVVDMLDHIDRVVTEDVVTIGKKMWLIVLKARASLVRDPSGMNYIRKYVRIVLPVEEAIATNGGDLVKTYEFRIVVGNIKKINYRDIEMPPLYEFEEDVQLLPVGLDFLQTFLANPMRYLKAY